MVRIVSQEQRRWRLKLVLACGVASLCDRTLASRMAGFKPLSSESHPSLLCIGAAKAGTTDLHKALTTLLPRHFNRPKGQMNDGKELLVLADKGFLSNATLQKEYLEMLDVGGPAPFTLDFSPLYLWSDAAPQNAARLLPGGTSVLAMLRDPVSHLVSWVNWRKGDNGARHVKAMDAGEVLLAEMALLSHPGNYRQLMAAVHAPDSAQAHASYLEVAARVDARLGDLFGPKFTNRRQGYVSATLGVLSGLRHWLDAFARPRRTLVVLSDAWYANRTDVWDNALMPFMFGDDEAAWPDYDSAWLTTEEPALKQSYAKEVPGAVRCALQAFFQPFVCALEQLLAEHPNVAIYPPGRLDGTCRPWAGEADLVGQCGGMPAAYGAVLDRLAVASELGGSSGSHDSVGGGSDSRGGVHHVDIGAAAARTSARLRQR